MNVLVVDDHSITRSGIAILIKEIFNPVEVHEAKNGAEAIALTKANFFDLCTLDFNLPDSECLTLIETLLTINPVMKILVISMRKEDVFAFKAIKTGALGYVCKENGIPNIKEALLRVSQGKRYASLELFEYFIDNDSKDSENPFFNLSSRELQIAKLIIEGVHTKGIGARLNLEVSTVSTYKRRIFEKLKITNTFELYELASFHKFNES